MTDITLLPEESKPSLKDVISFCMLILGSILISVGSFLALGFVFGLIVLGALLVIVSLILGKN